MLNVLRDFEERIQESELSWQIGAWRVSHPRSAVRSPAASWTSAFRTQLRSLLGLESQVPSASPGGLLQQGCRCWIIQNTGWALSGPSYYKGAPTAGPSEQRQGCPWVLEGMQGPRPHTDPVDG